MSKLLDQELSSNRIVFDADYRTGGIADRSPYKAAATVTAPVEWVRTRLGYGVRMTGTGLISYADNAANRLTGSDATFIILGGFDKRPTRTSPHLIDKTSGLGTSYTIYSANPTISYLVTSTGASIFNPIPAYANCLIVRHVHNAKPNCYADGTFAKEGGIASAITSVAAPLTVGNYYGGSFPQSIPINRITILNRALSAPEVAQLYQELMAERFPLRAYSLGCRISAPKDPPGVQALVKIDFTTTITPDPVTGQRRLADLSGNGWHGTVKPGFAAGPGMCGNALMANSATRSYVDFGEVPINGVSKLTVVHYGQRGGSNPSEIIIDKGTAANNRNEINQSTTQITWNVGSGGVIYAASVNDANVNAPLFQAWSYNGDAPDNGDKVNVNLDGAKPAVTITANFPATLPSTAGTPFTFGRLGWLSNFPPPKQSDFLGVYLGALTHEQTEYIRRQIAARSTFQLDMQRVPVSLANLVGPCEVPGTPFRLIGSWKVVEDAKGKHWLQSVTGGNMYPAYMRCTQAYGTYVFDVTHTAAIEWIVFIANTQAINYAQRNMYGLYLNGTDVQLNKLTPTGGLTTLFTAANAITIGTEYTFAVTRSNTGQFTVYIRGGSYKNWTKLVVTAGSNPVTDAAYSTSGMFYFTTTDATQGARFGNIDFFQGPLSRDQLEQLCPSEVPAINTLELFAFTTAKQIPSFVTAFSSSDAHTFVWGDGASDVLTSTGETKTHDYGSAGSRIIAFRVTDPLKLTTFHGFSNNLSGAVPSFARFVNLAVMTIYGNQLTGSIPDLSANVNLVTCNFENNLLTGVIPSLSNNTKLVDFRCHNGNSLTGPIPSLANNPELQYLYLGGSALTGSVPSLTNNIKLVHFYCAGAQITGYTPSTLASTIAVFNLQTNQLPQAAVDQVLADFATNVASRPASCTITLNGSGNAKPSLAGFASKTAILVAKPNWTVATNLQTIAFVTSNQVARFTTVFSPGDSHTYIWGDGTSETFNTTGENLYTHDYGSPGSRIIELSVTTAARLYQLHVNSRNLTGTIPNLSAYTALQVLYLYDNQLTGSIPSLTSNAALQSYNVDRNQLTGVIPLLTLNTALISFTCYHNQITGYTASTLSTTLTTFDAHDNLLTQAAVDQILANFATNVAARPAAGTITLNGTGNAAPSAAGIASRAAILAAKPGWTILVNS